MDSVWVFLQDSAVPNKQLLQENMNVNGKTNDKSLS